MKVFPNAKINIGLNIIARRPDGYHDLETVFYPIPLHDTLTIETTTEADTRLTVDGIGITGNTDDNLVMKAWQLYRKKITHQLRPAHLHLTKGIPSQAGLGGGSSDAAFTMKALNELCGSPLTTTELETLVGTLGADCPFFIRNRPVFAQGTGNLFTPVPLSLKNYWLLLVKPPVFIPTKEAFQHVTPRRPAHSLTDLLKQPMETWKDCIKNDFEDSVFPNHPLLPAIKAKLYKKGAVYASMSGSGSSLYGIFRQPLEEMETLFPDCFCRQLPLE